MSEHMHRITRITRVLGGAGRLFAKLSCLGALGVGVLIAGPASAVPSALAAPTETVDLGHASSYAALSGASVGNTVSAVGAPFTTLRGDLGVVANAKPTGFPPGVVTGSIDVGNDAAIQAGADAAKAYAEVAGRIGGATLAGALAGATISPGLYTIAGAASNTTKVTLDGGGDPNAVFVFQVGGAMTMAEGAQVVLTNGAQASNVFWQVNGAGAIGANAYFAGTLMAHDAVAVGHGSTVNGRAFALNGALTIDDDEFYAAPPVVTITGGNSAYTTDTTPTISGTANVEAPATVSVTINGQTLTATPAKGAWSVTSAILANGDYPITASVTDGAGNPGSATQQLTVDTVPPAIAIDGGPSATTNDPTPAIGGTTDVAPGALVHVTVDSQTLTALVQSGGWWNISPAALPDGAHIVVASVTDPAGNQSTAGQTLTTDTVAPAATITGGADALTNDAAPTISGSAAVAPGTTVTVNLADQTLTGMVGSDATWSVRASGLSDGPHRVVLSVSDEAGNPATFTQTLTVDTVAPIVTITGGATATTTNVDPTITGSSNAAPGTTVTVSIKGQTLTTLLQADGTWNATPSRVGDGSWPVVASDSDPAGNVGSARQLLTVGADLPPTSPSAAAGPSGSAASLAVTVECAADSSSRCKGLLSATSRVTTRGGKPQKVVAAVAQASKRAKGRQPTERTAVVVVASGSYSLAAGQQARVTLALNKHGQELLKRFHRVPATLKITGGAITATHNITFKHIRVRTDA
jgi:Ice-binding-like/Bacterial Ig-like domain